MYIEEWIQSWRSGEESRVGKERSLVILLAGLRACMNRAWTVILIDMVLYAAGLYLSPSSH